MNTMQAERRARGWSQAELARRAEMHPTTVCQIENRRTVPYPVQLAKLAAALEWTGDPGALMDEDARRA